MSKQITHNQLKSLTDIPANEQKEFDKLIKQHRAAYIKTTDILVTEVFSEDQSLKSRLINKDATGVILDVREAVWQKFLVNEAEFNTHVMTDLSVKLQTPREIIEQLANQHIVDKTGPDLIDGVIKVCGEYSGRVYPYIYALSLSNTQSRRSRSGSTFENIIYTIYGLLDYPFDSQRKVGKSEFTKAGLGKMVDSILPGIEEFSQRRDKVVIGTMKTTLRERWQEVSEEIQRTNIPKVYLLTVDDKISLNKAQQMANHNIIVVAPKDVASNPKLAGMRNIISFENYLFEELPGYLKYWEE